MTRNPTNRIPGLGFLKDDMTAYKNRAAWQRHRGDMLKPSTLTISFDEEDHLFGKLD